MAETLWLPPAASSAAQPEGDRDGAGPGKQGDRIGHNEGKVAAAMP